MLHYSLITVVHITNGNDKRLLYGNIHITPNINPQTPILARRPKAIELISAYRLHMCDIKIDILQLIYHILPIQLKEMKRINVILRTFSHVNYKKQQNY